MPMTYTGVQNVCVSTCTFFFFQAEDGIRDIGVTGVQTCALPSSRRTCAAPGGCCGPGARTWSARRSTATGSPTGPYPPRSAKPPPRPASTPTGSSSSAPSASSAAGPPTRRPFPPEHQERILAAVMAGITKKKNLNPKRRDPSHPQGVQRAPPLGVGGFFFLLA